MPVTVFQTNKTLLRVLGLDQIPKITRVDISMGINHLPQAYVTCYLPGQPEQTTTRLFELVEITEQKKQEPEQPPVAPFDLDALCNAALLRIEEVVNRSASTHSSVLRLRSSLHTASGKGAVLL